MSRKKTYDEEDQERQTTKRVKREEIGQWNLLSKNFTNIKHFQTLIDQFLHAGHRPVTATVSHGLRMANGCIPIGTSRHTVVTVAIMVTVSLSPYRHGSASNDRLGARVTSTPSGFEPFRHLFIRDCCRQHFVDCGGSWAGWWPWCVSNRCLIMLRNQKQRKVHSIHW